MRLNRIQLTGCILVFLVSTLPCYCQEYWKNHQVNLNESGTHYIKVNAIFQGWIRNLDYNPGSTVFGYPKAAGTDVGIRRYRVVLFSQVSDRVFFYSQFGENNYNNITDRKQGFFVHDAYGEYEVAKKRLSMGAGLSGWSGLSRFSAASVTTIMGLDAPIFLQSTNDVNDQFLRKLSFYVKGKLGRLDYRMEWAQPMAIQKSSVFNAASPLTTVTSFSAEPPKVQWNGYFQYQFLDQESNLAPYTTGTYLGSKNVFNIGAGFIYQKDALWQLASANDPNSIRRFPMKHWALDMYYDRPLGKKGAALHGYATWVSYDFGADYLRNSAIMNPANGSTQTDLLNGSGNGFPMYGTGKILYAQIGYKFPENTLGNTTIMPYAAVQQAQYDRLKDPMVFYDLGINWLLSGHQSKLTLAYQNRPLFNTNGDLIDRKGAWIAQYQIFLN